MIFKNNLFKLGFKINIVQELNVLNNIMHNVCFYYLEHTTQ